MVLGKYCSIKNTSFLLRDVLVIEEVKENDTVFHAMFSFSIILLRQGETHTVKFVFEHCKGAETAHMRLNKVWQEAIENGEI